MSREARGAVALVVVAAWLALVAIQAASFW